MLLQVVGIVPSYIGIEPVAFMWDIPPVVDVIFEMARPALSQVTELDFLDMNLDRVVKPIPMNHDAEIGFVVKVSRAADVIQRRGFYRTVLVLGLLRGVCHEDYQNIVYLSEVRQLIEQLADVLSFVAVALLALQTVVRVDDERLDTLAANEELGFFEDRVDFEIIRRADEIEVIFEVFLDNPVFPEFQRVLAEFLAGKLLYQL